MSLTSKNADQSGSFSNVIISKNHDLVIKVFKDQESRAAIREICIMRMLNHPNIVKITDTGYENKKFTILMKKYDKSTMNVGALNAATFSKWATQLIEAVQYLHSRDVIHADIKPANILYHSEMDCIVLTDFNISIIDSSLPKPSLVQTLMYRAPEVNTQYNRAIDIWSLGCVLYEWATGSYFIELSTCTKDSYLNASNALQCNYNNVNIQHIMKFLSSKIPEELSSWSRLIGECLLPQQNRVDANTLMRYMRKSPLPHVELFPPVDFKKIISLNYLKSCPEDKKQECEKFAKAELLCKDTYEVDIMMCARWIEYQFYLQQDRKKYVGEEYSYRIRFACIYISQCINFQPTKEMTPSVITVLKSVFF